MEELSNPVPGALSVEKRFNLPGRKGFVKGNPGKQHGQINHSTRVRNQLLACVGRDSLRLWKRALRDPKKFVKAMDQVIALLGPGKPLVLDQSQHTHFTVVVDGNEPRPE